MSDFVFTRRLDSLGRIVIPKEMRQFFNFESGEFVKIIPVQDGILLASNKEILSSDNKKQELS